MYFLLHDEKKVKEPGWVEKKAHNLGDIIISTLKLLPDKRKAQTWQGTWNLSLFGDLHDLHLLGYDPYDRMGIKQLCGPKRRKKLYGNQPFGRNFWFIKGSGYGTKLLAALGGTCLTRLIPEFKVGAAVRNCWRRNFYRLQYNRFVWFDLLYRNVICNFCSWRTVAIRRFKALTRGYRPEMSRWLSCGAAVSAGKSFLLKNNLQQIARDE